ncbi:MAG: hypothetical protein CMJ68_20770 [Planctomycetaceae bacterium]|nr:hypothetical protein [Planctomycetaceae bacterium]
MATEHRVPTSDTPFTSFHSNGSQPSIQFRAVSPGDYRGIRGGNDFFRRMGGPNNQTRDDCPCRHRFTERQA